MKKTIIILSLAYIGFLMRERILSKNIFLELENSKPKELEIVSIDDLEREGSGMLIPQRLEESTSIPLKSLPPVEKSVKNSEWTKSFQQAFAKCFQNEEVPSDFSNLMDTLQPKLTKSTIELSNWHLNLKNGKTKRVMLLPSEKENRYSLKDEASKNMVIKEFSVDNEGLPIPEGNGLKYTPKKLTTILSQGNIYFSEEQTRYESNSKESVLVVKQNGTLKSIEWYSQNQSFLCQQEASCICNSSKYVANVN